MSRRVYLEAVKKLGELALAKEPSPKSPISSFEELVRRKTKGHYAKLYGLKKKGWTLELLRATAMEQENKCAICKQSIFFERKMSKRSACADHNHSSPPKPRGLLCVTCNAAIGMLMESPELCEAAAIYLRKWKV